MRLARLLTFSHFLSTVHGSTSSPRTVFPPCVHPERRRRALRIRTSFNPYSARVLIVATLLMYHGIADSQELRRIFYGTSTSVAHLPVWVGKDTGLFAKNGLNIEPVQIRGGAISTMAIMSGQTVLSGAGSVIAARVEGGDIVLLACPTDLEPVYLIARPEIKSPSDLKGKAAGITRLNSSIHFYLRSAARMVGVDSDKEMTLLQLGGSPEIVTALESGRIAAAALTIRDVLPFIQRNWPVLVDLTKTDLVYPSSCVTSSRAFVKAEPKTVTAFLNTYVSAIQLIKKDSKLAERTLIKWLKEKESANLTKSVEAFVHPELFRDHGPLERALPKS